LEAVEEGVVDVEGLLAGGFGLAEVEEVVEAVGF
jgi:hypothetical protein